MNASGALASLKGLYLGENEIGDGGITAFADALSKGALPALERLSLEKNQIGDTGLSSFADALGKGALDKIESIDLEGNPGNSAAVNNALRERKK